MFSDCLEYSSSCFLICSSKFGISPYFTSAALLKSYSLSYLSTFALASSNFCFKDFKSIILPFSTSYLDVNESFSSLKLASSLSSSDSLFFDLSSSSFSKASLSVSRVNILLLTSSSSVGSESISLLIIAPASSIKSIALSGKNLS